MNVEMFKTEIKIFEIMYTIYNVFILPTDLPAKSDNDVMFCYKVIRDLESIGNLLLILAQDRINTKVTYRFTLAQGACAL